MNPQLFQSAEFYKRRYHNFATLLILPLTCLLIFMFLFSLWGQKEITVTSVGEIVPTKVISLVQSSSNNSVIENKLSENLKVKKGDVLIKYSQKMEESQIKAIQSQIDRDSRQENAISTLKDSLKQSQNLFIEADEFGYSTTVDQFLHQAETIRQQTQQANDSVAKQETSISQTNQALSGQIAELNTQIVNYQEIKDAIATDKSSISNNNPYISIFNSYQEQIKTDADEGNEENPTVDTKSAIKNQILSELQANIDNLKTSVSSLKTQVASNVATGTYDNSQIESLRNQQLTQADTTLTQVTEEKETLQAQLDQTHLEQNQTELVASDNGILHLKEGYHKQTLLPQGTTLAEIYPDISAKREVAIDFYIDSNHLNEIKKGQTVRLTLEKISNQKLQIVGKVSKIATSATQTKNGSLFKITATATLKKKDSHQLKYGLQGKLVSIIGKKSFFNYYKDKLLKDFT